MNGETGGKPFTILQGICGEKKKKKKSTQKPFDIPNGTHSYTLISKLNKFGGAR